LLEWLKSDNVENKKKGGETNWKGTRETEEHPHGEERGVKRKSELSKVGKRLAVRKKIPKGKHDKSG